MKKILTTIILATGLAAQAQGTDYPQRPVTLVVPFAAGASLGTVAHLVGERLTARLGQPFIVEYKPGASGSVGTAQVARSKPDGYTLLVSATGPMSIVPVVYGNLPYQSSDLTPIAQFMRVPFVVAAQPAFQGKTVKELLDLIKANPGKYHFASTGNGTLTHLAAQLLVDQAGGQVTHVPYTAAAQVATALMRNDVLFSVANISGVSAYFADGRIKPLATTGKARFPVLPDVPTVAESGVPGFEVSHYVGLLGPKGMAPEVVQKLNTHIAEILREPAIQQAFRGKGDLAVPATVAEFSAIVDTDLKKWGDAARKIGLKNE